MNSHAQGAGRQQYRDAHLRAEIPQNATEFKQGLFGGFLAGTRGLKGCLIILQRLSLDPILASGFH